MMPVGLRSLGRSAIHPPANFAKLENPSETPSITPSANAGAPKLARNAGRIAVAASWPQSENKLARPMPKTPRVSQRCGGGGVAGFGEAGDETFMVYRPTVSESRCHPRARQPKPREEVPPHRKCARPKCGVPRGRATRSARTND